MSVEPAVALSDAVLARRRQIRTQRSGQDNLLQVERAREVSLRTQDEGRADASQRSVDSLGVGQQGWAEVDLDREWPGGAEMALAASLGSELWRQGFGRG